MIWKEVKPAGDSPLYWELAAINSDGSNIIVGYNDYYGGGTLYTTFNGKDWTGTLSGMAPWGWGCVAMSPDNSYTIAGALYARLYLSNNRVDWTETQPAGDTGKAWKCAAINSNGSHMIVGVQNGRLYTTTNSGVDWTETRPIDDGNYSWWDAAISADGSHMIVVIQDGRVYTTLNGGNDWTETRPIDDAGYYWLCAAISSDGSSMVVGNDSALYISHNSGADWSEASPAGGPAYWFCTDIASDKSHMVAGSYDNYLYTSINGGVDWTAASFPVAGSTNWASAAISSDSSTIIAGGYPSLYKGGSQGVTAYFTANKTGVRLNELVTFQDLSLGEPSLPDTWDWTFGDSTHSFLQNPSHAYATVSKFTVALTVSRGDQSDTYSRMEYILATEYGWATILDEVPEETEYWRIINHIIEYKNMLFVAGTPNFTLPLDFRGIRRSSDFGNTWTTLMDGSQGYALCIKNDALYLSAFDGTSMGLYKTLDGTAWDKTSITFNLL